ncbi:ABC transporter ATP-binding protein [Microbacterium luticocti]|uniref:ABC transporter ATP-binding protein n=1 Tax=Microbacterium luticocti TaxID=451764 RepID=UPI0003F7BA0C|nr:ABC transporter ATP-binding protein [Microbacterium luticocti]
MLNTSIRLRRVRVEFSSAAETVVALDLDELDILQGTLTAVLGVSGSGKTTLLNVIAGLEPDAVGEVEVLGEHLNQKSERERAEFRLRHIGVVFQDHNLIPEFTVDENVELPLRAQGMKRSEAKGEATLWIDRVGLAGMESRRPAELSGGQRQRVGVARALAGGRQILIADEPTGSLDTATSESILSLLHGLAESGVTVIVATHDPQIIRFTNRVLRIHDGRLVDPAVVDTVI